MVAIRQIRLLPRIQVASESDTQITAASSFYAGRRREESTWNVDVLLWSECSYTWANMRVAHETDSSRTMFARPIAIMHGAFGCSGRPRGDESVRKDERCPLFSVDELPYTTSVLLSVHGDWV